MIDFLVIAVHPDDETLGCGASLLRHVSLGHNVHWLIVTSLDSISCPPSIIDSRQSEINLVSSLYGFSSVTCLDYPTTKLDTIPLSDLVSSISGVVESIKPSILYLPFPGDAHSDHRCVYDAASSAAKCFRFPSVEKVLVCETPSETEFGISPIELPFRPNLFIDVSSFIDKKVEIMSVYKSEMGDFPFPRSEQTLRSLAQLRGSQSGVNSAEAFMILKEIVK